MPTTTPTVAQRIASGLASLTCIKAFIGKDQTTVVRSMIRNSEERDFFIDKMIALEALIAAMPVTYEQDGKGDAAVAYLHYFTAGCDFYITEKDKGDADDSPEDAQSQAYGYTILNGDDDMAEMGYISLPEILSCRAELDFYFKPTPLGEIKARRAA